MNRPDYQTDSRLFEDVAALWFARRRDGLAPEEEAKFQAWLKADPRHAAAMANLQAGWNVVSFPAATGRTKEAGQVLDRWAAGRRRRRCTYAAIGVAAAAVTLAFLTLRKPTSQSLASEAFVVHPNIETLPDGSTAELNDGAEVAVQFGSEKRAVRLVHGEALFAVKKNPARPFVVLAGEIEVHAIGTAFSVRFDPQQVGVLVTEGRVAVERAVSPGASAELPPDRVYLGAGDRIAVAAQQPNPTASAVRPLTAAEMSAALAWRGKRVEFSRMPLSDAVELFNRQNPVQLVVVDQLVRTIPISGIFWIDDPEAFSRLLESGMGVSVKRTGRTISLGSQ